MTTTLRQHLSQHNPVGATWAFVLAVMLLLPALLFSRFMPDWAPFVALAGLVVIFALRSITVGGGSGYTPLDWPLLLLLLLLAGLWTTLDLSVSLPRTYGFIANLALFGVVAAQRNASWLRWCGWLLLLAGLVGSPIIFLYTDLGGNQLPFINQDIYALLPDDLRPFWNQGFNSNVTGGVLTFFLAPAVALIFRGESWQQRDFAKLVAVVLSILLVLTQARGAIIGAIIALLVITSLQSRRWSLFWLVVVVAAAIRIYYSGLAPVLEVLLGKGDLLGDSNLRGRLDLWQQAIHLIRDFPLAGVGLGMVEPAIKLLYPTSLIDAAASFHHVHNIYLQTAAEMGIPGLIVHLLIYLSLFYLLLQRARDDQAGRSQALTLGLLGSLIAFLVNGFLNVIIFSPLVAVVVWSFFGLMVAVATSSINER